MARVIFLAATVPMDALKATLKLILEMYPVFECFQRDFRQYAKFRFVTKNMNFVIINRRKLIDFGDNVFQIDLYLICEKKNKLTWNWKKKMKVQTKSLFDISETQLYFVNNNEIPLKFLMF